MTLLYLAGAVLLAVIAGAVSYSLVSYYFGTNTDHALKVKMGLQFAAFDIPLTPELYNEVRQAGLVITLPESETEAGGEGLDHEKNEGLQETELADIFVFPLTETAELLPDLISVYPVSLIDQDSARQALKSGSDWRTVSLANGVKLRLFSYRVPGNYPVSVFQVGRYLTGQHNVLAQLLRSMFLIGGLSILVISGAAWLLAGRTIRPIQETWDKQQEFVANASHELRAPLTLIRAGVEIASRSAQDLKQKQLLEDALLDSDHMNKLIEELLLLSRLDSKAQQIDLREIALVQFFQPIIRQLKLSVTTQHVTLIEEIQELKILADPQRVEQLILILFDNALQHTPTGGSITITAKKEGDKGCIRILDTGTGIPEEHLDRVFERFYRSKQTNHKGSGLGLSIAKSLVEIQKGTITIKNRVPTGLEVIIRFPLSGDSV